MPASDVRALERELERNQRYLEFLVRAGDVLGSSLRYDETLRAISTAAVESIADICLIDIGTRAHDLHLAAAAAKTPDVAEELSRAGRFLRSQSGYPAHPVLAVAASGASHLATAIDDRYLADHASSAEHAAFMRRRAYRSIIVVPLETTARGVLGTLTLVRTDASAERYDETSLRFAADLGRRCGTAIAKARLYEQNERIATRFQRAALPSDLPTVPNLALDGLYEPSSEDLLVGGDWYDAFSLPDGRLAITIGDVLGHGLDAAVWMSRMRNGFRAALLADPDPGRALAIGDTMLRLETGEQFTTAIIALLDPVRLTMTCASAGHPGPLVWDADSHGVIDPFGDRGIPLGLAGFERGLITSPTITLYPGAFAAFFTDGLLEWDRNIDAAWASLHRAIALPQIRYAEHPAHALREAVIDGAPHADDLAILTIRCEQREQN